MAKYKPKPKPNYSGKKRSKRWADRPNDFLRGGNSVGDKYTAWDTYGQGKPDFGKGAGPGEPYHEVTKTLGIPDKPTERLPDWGRGVPGKGISRNLPKWIPKAGVPRTDARTAAIRKRLGWQ